MDYNDPMTYPGEQYQTKRLDYLRALAPLCRLELLDQKCTPQQIHARMEYDKTLRKCLAWETQMGF